MRARNALFDLGILPSVTFDLPVISVGNLAMGGTGKTPHVEYLIRLLDGKHRIATLSRGYGRKTSGFLIAGQNHTASEVGDEALQYKNKFPEIIVAVDENRRHGIRRLLMLAEPPQVILMDDAFQHRYVKPGVTILLTDYYDLYSRDHMLPSGRLREPRSGAKRAEMIVVTKTMQVFSPILARQLEEELHPRALQKICYSYIVYENPVSFSGIMIDLSKKTTGAVLLVAGIANPYTLEFFLKEHFTEVTSITFRDHHVFTSKDVTLIRNAYEMILGRNKIIITTEKDAMRMKEASIFEQLNDLPIYFIPIRIEFHKNSKQLFDTYILDYVERSK